MAAVATAGMIAGAYRAQVCYRDSNGYPKGVDSTPDAVSNGATMHPYLIPGFVECTAPTATRSIAQRRAGQVITGQRALGVSDLGNFTLTLADYDETFNSIVGETAVDVSLATDVAMSAPNSNNPDPPALILLLTMGFQSVAGVDQYLTYIYNNVQITNVIPGVTQADGVNPNPLAYTVIPRSSPRTALGYLYSATGLTVYNNSDIAVCLRYTSPFSITTYIDDASATSFVTGYRPVSADHAGVVNYFTKNGATSHANVSGFSTTTGATTHTAGSAGDIWVATYATDFVAI